MSNSRRSFLALLGAAPLAGSAALALGVNVPKPIAAPLVPSPVGLTVHDLAVISDKEFSELLDIQQFASRWQSQVLQIMNATAKGEII